MTAATPASAPAVSGFDARAAVVSGSIVLLEALIMAVMVALVPKIIGVHAESPSAWAVILLTGAAFLTSRWLSDASFSPAKRRAAGALLTVVALQVFARVDLSESLRIWDFGWITDLADPDSQAWRQFGRIDHVIGAVLLFIVWFRGVRLGGMELEDRPLVPLVLVALAVFALGFGAGDAAGVIDTVRLSALAFIAAGLAAVAFRNAGRVEVGHESGFAATGWTFLSTFGALAVVIVIFMLLVTALLALIAGSGIAEPVTDALGVVLRGIVTGIAYAFWPLLWLIQQIFQGGGEMPIIELPDVILGDNPIADRDLTPNAADDDGGSNAGAALVRVFGAIGVIMLFTTLVFFLFRRLNRRHRPVDELRESIWAEADILDDLLGGLRSLRDRFRGRIRRDGRHDAPIAELYFDVLAHAEAQGAIRHPARTPMQFAPVLRRTYRSDIPFEISQRFSELRYAGRDTPEADAGRLQQGWRTLIEDADR